MGVKYYFNYNKYFTEEEKRLKDVAHLGIEPLKRLKRYDGKEVVKLKECKRFYLANPDIICRSEWLDRGKYEN